jgi:SAM-dependent methyltransferase
MIHQVPHEVSEGLRKENEAYRLAADGATIEWMRSQFQSCEHYFRDYRDSAEGAQLREALKEVPRGGRILDIGAGYGKVAFYLISLGYPVTALEPSLDVCRYMERVADLFGIELEIYQATAEVIDRLPVRRFDACMFNASLHHSEDPLRALLNCHEVLAPGGKVFLLNEPLLQRFRSKAWFARQLAKESLVTGDYGGNEHTYYRHEYLAMLRQAGFVQVRDRVSLRYVSPRSYLKSLEANQAGRWSIRARLLYYRAIGTLSRSGMLGKPVLGMMNALSMLQTTFVATKRSAA